MNRDGEAGAAEIVVVTSPDPHFAALPVSCFAGGKMVLDCWGVLPKSVAELDDLVRLGRVPAV